MRRLIFCLLLLTPVAFLWGCKKGGPAQPYDSKLENVSGNMILAVKMKGAAQSGVTVNAVDSDSVTHTGVTDWTGTTGFNFDYQRYFVEQSKPLFTMLLPAQWHYAPTTCTMSPANGPNTFYFTNDPSLTVTATLGAPTSYAYNVTNTLGFTCVYDKGGTVEVPVSIRAANVPSSWTVSYETSVLGRSTTQCGVTFTIPSSEYRQNAISMVGLFNQNADGSTFVCSPAFTITRAFAVGLNINANCSFTGGGNGSDSTSGFFAGAGLSISSTNGSQIPWNYYIKVTGPPMGNCGGSNTYLEKSGVITGSGNASWGGTSQQTCQNRTAIQVYLHVWNDQAGSIECSGTGSTNYAGAGTASASTSGSF